LDESTEALGRLGTKAEDNESNLKQTNFKLKSMMK
jgi:hypothetical protein